MGTRFSKTHRLVRITKEYTLDGLLHTLDRQTSNIPRLVTCTCILHGALGQHCLCAPCSVCHQFTPDSFESKEYTLDGLLCWTGKQVIFTDQLHVLVYCMVYWDNTVSVQCSVYHQFTPDSFESPLGLYLFGLGLPCSSEGWLSTILDMRHIHYGDV